MWRRLLPEGGWKMWKYAENREESCGRDPVVIEAPREGLVGKLIESELEIEIEIENARPQAFFASC